MKVLNDDDRTQGERKLGAVETNTFGLVADVVGEEKSSREENIIKREKDHKFVL